MACPKGEESKSASRTVRCFAIDPPSLFSLGFQELRPPEKPALLRAASSVTREASWDQELPLTLSQRPPIFYHIFRLWRTPGRSQLGFVRYS